MKHFAVGLSRKAETFVSLSPPTNLDGCLPRPPGRRRPADRVHRRDLPGVRQHAAGLPDLLPAAVHLRQHAQHAGEGERAPQVSESLLCSAFSFRLLLLFCVILNGRDSALSLIQREGLFSSQRPEMIHVFRQSRSSPVSQAPP